MKQSANTGHFTSTQKKYSLSLKVQLVEEIERELLTKSKAKFKLRIQGNSPLTKWLQKYDNFDRENQIPFNTCYFLFTCYNTKLLPQPAQPIPLHSVKNSISGKELHYKKSWTQSKNYIFPLPYPIKKSGRYITSRNFWIKSAYPEFLLLFFFHFKFL